jgi:RNA polymerase sigma-70 factor (ECF subfamily)
MLDATDGDLVLATRQGRAEAYGELVRRYQGTVFGVCYRLAGERREAEDLAQETFLRAYQRLGTFDVRRPFGPWVRRVAANVCLNRLPRAPAAAALDDERDEDEAAGGDGPEVAWENAELSATLRAALLSLPPHYRAVVELRHFHDMSYAAIAAELNLPLSDVKSHLFRARRLLAQKLKTYA